MNPMTKSAATMGGAIGVGAGGGAAAGLLATLFEENPTLKKAVKNTLVGGAGGAAIGAGVKALDGAGGDTVVDGAAPSPDKPGGMNLNLAALSGIFPGIGPGLHGGLTEGAGQAVGSAAASVAGPYAILGHAMSKANQAGQTKLPGKAYALSTLASILGATGAAYAGNKIREKE